MSGEFPDNIENMSEKIEQEAANWVDILDDIEAGENPAGIDETLAEFNHWIAADVRHKVAFDRIEKLYNSQELSLALCSFRENQASIEVQKPIPEKTNTAWFWKGGFFIGGASFASILLAGILFFPMMFDSTDKPILNVNDQKTVQEYLTQVGERRVFSLSDGSKIHLNANSRIAYGQTDSLRKVMLKKGSAFFEVFSDKTKPFIVETKYGDIQVIGTAFSVESQSNYIRVLVEEGHVKVVNDSATDLFAKQKVVIDQKGTNAVTKLKLGEAAGQWRTGWIDIQSVPLNEVLAELQNYLEKPVIIADQLPKPPVISGRYHLDEPVKALDLVASLNGFILEEEDDAFYLRIEN